MAAGEFIEILSPSALKDLNTLNAELVKTVAYVSEVNKLMGTAKTPGGSNTAIKDLNEKLAKQEKLYASVQVQLEKYKQAQAQTEIKENQLAQSKMRLEQAIERQNKKALESVAIEKQLEESFKKGIKSKNDAVAQNKLLMKAVGDLDLTTVKGRETLKTYNSLLDKNTAFIRDNSDAATKQRMNIGNYAESIQQALEKTGLFNTQLGQTVQATIGFVQGGKQATDAIKDFSGAVVNNVKAFIGYKTATIQAAEAQAIQTTATESQAVAMGTAAVATEAEIMATEGLIVAEEGATVATVALEVALGLLALPIILVVGVVALLFAGLSKLDPIMDKIEQTTAGLMGGFSAAARVITDFVMEITSLEDGMEKVAKVIAHPIDAIKSFTKEVTKAYTATSKLKEAEQDLGDLKDIYEVRSKNIESQINLDKIRLKNKHLSAKEEEVIEKRISDNYVKLSKMRNDITSKNTDLAVNAALLTSHKLTKIDKDRLLESIRLGDIEVANRLLNIGKIETEAYEKIKEAVNLRIDANNKAAEDEERTMDKIEKARDRVEARAAKQREAAAKQREKDRKDREEEAKKGIVGSEAAIEGEITRLKQVRTRTADTTEEYKAYNAQIFILEESLKRLKGEAAEFDGEALKLDMSELGLTIKGFEEYKKGLSDTTEQTKILQQATDDFIKGFGPDFIQNSGLGSLNDFFDGTFKTLAENASNSKEEFAVYFKSIADVAQETFQFINQQSNQRFENEKNQLSAQKEIALQFAGDSAAAKEKIEKEYDQKRRVIAAKEAKAKKQAAIFNISIDLAQALIGLWANPGFPAAIPMSIAVGALGAAQLAMVSAQKIPEFYKGTDNAPGGLAWTNERGAEIHTDKHGNIKDFGTDKGATLKHLDKGDKIYNAYETKKMLSNADFDTQLMNILTARDISAPVVVNGGIKASEMDDLLKKHIASQSKTNISFDKGGFSRYISNNGNITRRSEDRGNAKGLSV